jgi:hypothetical protein
MNTKALTNVTNYRVASINGNAEPATSYAVNLVVKKADGWHQVQHTFWHNSKIHPSYTIGDEVIVADLIGSDNNARATIIGKA